MAGFGARTRRAAGAFGPAPERAASPDAAREAALRLLERMRRTRFDLTRRLREKGYATAVVEEVLDRLTAVGLVDDVEYARAFLAGRWGRRAAGWRRLEAELRNHGVPAGAIAEARSRLEAQQGVADEVGAARKALAQAARRYQNLDPRLRRQRLYALLVRRGFDGDTIQAALANEGVAVTNED
jgi:regulatory protein